MAVPVAMVMADPKMQLLFFPSYYDLLFLLNLHILLDITTALPNIFFLILRLPYQYFIESSYSS